MTREEAGRGNEGGKRMTREEAITELQRMAATIEWDYPLEAQIAIEMAVAALREKQQRQPDPITGLVPCGCGGKAHIINSSGYSRRLYVECDRCDIMLGVEATGDGALQGIYRYDDQIIKDWNQAMGWKGDAE